MFLGFLGRTSRQESEREEQRAGVDGSKVHQ